MKRHLTDKELIQYRFKLASDRRMQQFSGHVDECVRCRDALLLLNRKFAALELLREDIKASDELISMAVGPGKRQVVPKVVSFGKHSWIGAAAAVLVVGVALLIGSLAERRRPQSDFAAGPQQPDKRLHGRLEPASEAAEGSDDLVVAKDVGRIAQGPLAEELARRDAPGTPLPGLVADMAPRTSDAKGSVADRSGEVGLQYSFARGRPMDAEETELGALTTALPDASPVEQRPALRGESLRQQDQYALHTVGGEATAGAAGLSIPEQAPFAPASAIELVVLPRRDSVQITIYNSADLTLVRERRNLTLKRGWNWLQLAWANTLIDPTSLDLEPLQDANKIDVQQLVFPARLRELGRWLIRSEVSGRVPFQITYFTGGLSWRAFYMGTLSQDEKTMRLDGYVRVGNNSGEDYENAQTRLIVGKMHLLDQIADLARRQYPYGRPVVGYGYGGAGFGGYGGMRAGDELSVADSFAWAERAMTRMGELRPKEIKKEGLSEYFLYTIEGTETIADKWGKRLLSFEAEDIPVKSLYKYDEERWGEQTIRFVSFSNDKKHNLGDTPIPNGTVRIYSQADEQGYLSYVGGTDIKYIPVNEEVELNLGTARLVSVEPILMDFKTDNYVFDGKKNVAGWDETRTWKIEVTNTRTLPIEIEVTRGFGTAYWTLQFDEKDVSYEKHDATHARFKLELEPRTKRAFEYTVTTYHGTREEVMAKR